MQNKIILYVFKGLMITLCITSCQQKKKSVILPIKALEAKVDSLKEVVAVHKLRMQRQTDSLKHISEQQERLKRLTDQEFIDVSQLSDDFVLDMRYATSNNFLKEAVYPCGICLIRGAVAKALLEASEDFKRQGYRIKFYDCYRPLQIQKKMWKIMPKPGYVANPKGGSVHNKGAAVDITLVDIEGNELDMGTDFDHFGREAAQWYTKLSDTVLQNRKRLRNTMQKHGFSIIRSEWWHYNYKRMWFPIADIAWNCKK